MIEREITPRLTALFRQYPFVTVTGPRQSGKTTLCRASFPDLEYANLEAPDQRDFAESDPKGFLARFVDGAIIDEIQRVPELLSHLQVVADERGGNGLFVLTGSEQFRLSDAINQSLAGRTALLRLLPFSLTERQRAGEPGAVDEILYSGFYPRIIDQRLNPTQALADYFETYVERDVRRMGEIRNLSNFRRFVRLCAGRVGQLINLSSLGADAGVSHTTAREWLTVLEASYILFQLPPYHANISKRLVKSPKLYFCDTGLAAYLIGIENAGQVATHPSRRFVRKYRRRGGAQTPFQSWTTSQFELFSRFEGAGVRPLVSCRWGYCGIRGQIRGHRQLGALSAAASDCQTGAGRYVENRGVRWRDPAVQKRQRGNSAGRFARGPEDARRQHGNCRLC